MKFIRKIVLSFNILLVFVSLLAYLSPYVDPTVFWGLSFLGLIVPILLFLNLLFVFYWMITRWKYSWISIVCLLLGANYITLIISFSAPSSKENGDFSIASYNMNYAYGTLKKGAVNYDKKNTALFSGFIKKELNPDVLCAQESNEHIRKLINDHYKFQHAPSSTGTAIFSIYPIVGQGRVEFGTKTNSCVWADLKIKNDTIRVYSAHLQSNRITAEANQLVKEAENEQKVDIVNVRSIFSKYKKYVSIRAKQAHLVNAHMNASPYPVILAGDFNDPPVSYTHRVLTRDKQDAFAKAGYGLGRTYAGNIPLLRIDNIIVDDNFIVNSYEQFIRKKFSDHYPVKSYISFSD